VSDINKLLIEWEKLWLVSHGPSVVKIRLELTSGIQQVMIDPGLFRYCLNRLVESTLASQDLQHPLRILLASNQVDGQAEIFITIFGVDRSAEDVEKIRLLLAKEESIIPELFEFDPSLLITKGIICYYEGSIDLESLGGRGTMIRISLPIVYTEN